jgi:hypothetical protein
MVMVLILAKMSVKYLSSRIAWTLAVHTNALAVGANLQLRVTVAGMETPRLRFNSL